MDKNNVRYSIGQIKKGEIQFLEEEAIRRALALDNGDSRIVQLTECIIKLLNNEDQRISPICIDGISWGDVVFSPTETLLAYLLFERAVTSCNVALKTGEMQRIDLAFVDFNFAIHFSLSPQMLGLCCLYRAFFLPKEKGIDFSKNIIMQNELNIVKQLINTDSEVYKKFVGNYDAKDMLPDVNYYFLSDSVSENIRYKYTYKISSLSDYIPIFSPNPNICFRDVKEVSGLLVTILQSRDYQLLSNFKFEKNAFEINYI